MVRLDPGIGGKGRAVAAVTLGAMCALLSQGTGSPCVDGLAPLSALRDSSTWEQTLDYLVGLYSTGRAEKAVSTWRAWVEASPRVLSRIDRLYWYCLALMDAEHVGDAAALLEEARSAGVLDAGSSSWHEMSKALLTAAYAELGEYENCARLAAEVARYGSVPEARLLASFALARAYEALGDSASARRVWEVIVATWPDSPEAVYAAHRLERSSRPRPPSQGAGREALGDRYCLHVGSTRHAAEASALAARIGPGATIREDAVPGGSVYTVLVGGFESLEAARAARARLQGVDGVVVIPCPDAGTGSPDLEGRPKGQIP